MRSHEVQSHRARLRAPAALLGAALFAGLGGVATAEDALKPRDSKDVVPKPRNHPTRPLRVPPLPLQPSKMEGRVVKIDGAGVVVARPMQGSDIPRLEKSGFREIKRIEFARGGTYFGDEFFVELGFDNGADLPSRLGGVVDKIVELEIQRIHKTPLVTKLRLKR